MKTTQLSFVLSFAILAVSGCKQDKLDPAPRTATAQQQASTTPKAQMPAGHPPMGGPQGMGHGGGAPSVAGKVLETMDAGGYSYIKLETAKGPVWAAVQKAPIKVGQQVAIARPMLMKNFKSKTLNRSFDAIYFGRLGSDQSPHGGAKGATGQVAAAHAKQRNAKVSVDKVEKAQGGHTVAEVFGQRKALANKTVRVRGKVTKFNAGIMGRNWIHLQDGTGSEKEKTYDLTVTSQSNAKIGDIVVVEGTLAVDKNFGAGYAYPAIIENATIKN